jgi:DNA-binding NtrC family response regulator
LRVIEQREIRRVGGNRTIKVDIRIIAATKQDLAREVQKGKFREDLYFRLSVVPIRMPSLRERKDDLPQLVRSFLARMYPGEGRSIDDATMAALTAHDWPGNVRELRNVLERGAVLSAGSDGNGAQPMRIVMTPSQASLVSSSPAGGAVETTATGGVPPFEAALSFRQNKERWENEFEKRYLRWLLARAQGNISRAAREADMDRKYLHKLVKKHQIVV